jgi:hypothetical protein
MEQNLVSNTSQHLPDAADNPAPATTTMCFEAARVALNASISMSYCGWLWSMTRVESDKAKCAFGAD